MTGGSQAGKTSTAYVSGGQTYVTGGQTYTTPISGQTVTYTTGPQTYEYIAPSSTTYVETNGYHIDPKTNQYTTAAYEYVSYPETYTVQK